MGRIVKTSYSSGTRLLNWYGIYMAQYSESGNQSTGGRYIKSSSYRGGTTWFGLKPIFDMYNGVFDDYDAYKPRISSYYSGSKARIINTLQASTWSTSTSTGDELTSENQQRLINYDISKELPYYDYTSTPYNANSSGNYWLCTVEGSTFTGYNITVATGDSSYFIASNSLSEGATLDALPTYYNSTYCDYIAHWKGSGGYGANQGITLAGSLYSSYGYCDRHIIVVVPTASSPVRYTKYVYSTGQNVYYNPETPPYPQSGTFNYGTDTGYGYTLQYYVFKLSNSYKGMRIVLSM